MENQFKIKHEYIIGSLDRIKKGEIEDLPKTFDLEEAKLLFPTYLKDSSSIILPDILGVYRRFLVGDENAPYEKRIGTEFNFQVHPSLVQIGYDSNLFDREILSQFIGDQSSRMKIVPYEELRIEGENFKKLSELYVKRLRNAIKGNLPTKEESNLVNKLVRDVLSSDGLTFPEYMLWINSFNLSIAPAEFLDSDFLGL